MARLVVISKNVSASPLELGEAWATIGRADGNSFQVVESSVSGRHCEVRLRGEELVVRDLLSTNGTFVNGEKISEATIKPGESFRVGDVEVRFEASSPSQSGAFTSKMLMTKAAAPAPKPAKEAAPEKKPADETGDESVKKFQVLFVDDSMAFLETFGGLCTEYANKTWAVHTAASADRALAILPERAIDLVVLDIGMPMLDGLQLLGIIRRRYPGIKITVMTGRASEARRSDALANGADLFLEKPTTAEGMKSAFNMLNDLVTWAHREGFTGSLRNVGLQEVIQMECIGRHSSILEIRNPQIRGQVYIEAGVITHAAVGTFTGDQAFFRLLSLRGGEFQIKPFHPPPQRTIQNRWEFLLLEAARASDEETVLTKKPGTPPEPPRIPPAEKDEHAAMGEDIVVVATYDGKWHPADGGKK